MKFNEQFPSLAYKQKVISFNVEEHNGNRWDDSIHYLSKEVIDLEDVKKHTIDKSILTKIVYSANLYEDIIKEIEKLLVIEK